MSDMKHDALTSQGIEIAERVPIPDDLVPADAHVEIAARRPRVTTRPSRSKTRTTPSAVRSKSIREAAALSLANPETSAALTLLSAKAVRERAHRMLAIGLEASFRTSASTSIAWTAQSIWCWKRRARPILRSTCRFIRAGGTSSPMGTIDGLPSPTGPAGPIARPAPGPNSIWPSSASSSMPAPVHRGASAIRNRISHRPFGRIGAGQPCHVHGRRILGCSP